MICTEAEREVLRLGIKGLIAAIDSLDWFVRRVSTRDVIGPAGAAAEARLEQVRAARREGAALLRALEPVPGGLEVER